LVGVTAEKAVGLYAVSPRRTKIVKKDEFTLSSVGGLQSLTQLSLRMINSKITLTLCEFSMFFAVSF
jgi:hypothetical protein